MHTDVFFYETNVQSSMKLKDRASKKKGKYVSNKLSMTVAKNREHSNKVYTFRDCGQTPRALQQIKRPICMVWLLPKPWNNRMIVHGSES
ncbi:hypothetical protein SUGI_0092730 [Cryptomeria japonica]|nr:hypothetical protein SUGI_0092730 [Cryptomeria japonica]